MPIAYRNHGGLHQVAIVYVTTILGEGWAHLSKDGPQSWALRDCFTRQMLRNSPPPNHSSSPLLLVNIEGDVRDSEPPPFHAYDKIADWDLYLRMRTNATFGTRSIVVPNPSFGSWEALT